MKKIAIHLKYKMEVRRMKIAVVCANGKAGKLIVEEAIARNIDVTAIARGDNRTKAKNYIEKDIFDISYNDVKDFDVIVDAFGTWEPGTLSQHSTTLKHLCDLLSNKDKRLLVVGGAGSLYVNQEHTIQVMDGIDFPDMFKPLASHMGKALEELRTRNDVKWTYISPAADFQADGIETGSYILGGEELILNSKGESKISYADYAIAIIDEATQGNNIQKRISVVSE